MYKLSEDDISEKYITKSLIEAKRELSALVTACNKHLITQQRYKCSPSFLVKEEDASTR